MGPPSTRRALALASWTLLAGCSALLDLGELQKADCLGADCGGMTQGSGNGGHGGVNVAGSHTQAGSSPTPVAGRGGNASSAGSGDAGETADGGASDSGGSGGSAAGGGGSGGVSTGGGGSGGVSTGGAGSGGTSGASAGAGGQAGGSACQPAAVDKWCDGLDQACSPTNNDAACANVVTCKGVFVQGSAYMSCLAANDFDSAEARCQANGMHLAKIDSALENAAVLSMAQDDYVWVGGSNRANQNVYTWADNAAFGYQNFEPGQPVKDVNKRCVQLMPGGTWSNWLCSEPQSFVCERY